MMLLPGQYRRLILCFPIFLASLLSYLAVANTGGAPCPICEEDTTQPVSKCAECQQFMACSLCLDKLISTNAPYARNCPFCRKRLAVLPPTQKARMVLHKMCHDYFPEGSLPPGMMAELIRVCYRKGQFGGSKYTEAQVLASFATFPIVFGSR